MPRNVSLFAIPVYWLLVMLTRGYSALHIKQHAQASQVQMSPDLPPEPALAPRSDQIIDNASPHSSATADRIRRSLRPTAFAKWERIEAAHRNGIENMALFFAAVIVANVGRVNALELNMIAWLYIASRCLYVVLYVRISTNPASYARSAIFGVGILLCWYLIFRGAVQLISD